MTATSSFTADPAMTAIAVAYKNQDYQLIADEVLPRVNAPAREFGWYEFNEEEMYTVPDTRVGPRSSPNQVEIEGTRKTSECEDYGIDVPLDLPTIQKGEKAGFKPKAQAVARGANIVLLDREVRVARFAADPSNYHRDLVSKLAVKDKLTDYANSDPYGLITEMLDKCLIRPNQIAMGQEVWTRLRRHPKLVREIRQGATTEAVLKREEVADLLEVKRLLVGEARVNVKKPGQKMSLARAWGNFISGQFIDRSIQNTEEGVLTWGFTAQFGSKVAGTLNANMGLRGGVLVRAGETVKEVSCATRAGFLLQDVV